MIIIKSTLDYLNTYNKQLNSKKIGFVPTMGYLHEGHLSLVKESIKNNEVTIVSIFVNPTQFGKGEDFNSYPRNTERDLALLKETGTDIVFIPEVEDIYPNNHKSLVEIGIDSDFTNKLCGKYRPGHFNGVAQIIIKLFSIVKANNTYFGLKDYQQYILIKNLASTFFPYTKVIGVPTIRENSGLAMSSRNTYLTEDEQLLASSIYKNLIMISNIIKENVTINHLSLAKLFNDTLLKKSSLFTPQYLEVYDTNLNQINTYIQNQTFIGTAVYLNKVRLIDNITF